MSIRIANRLHTVAVDQAAAGYLQIAAPKTGRVPRVVSYNLVGAGASVVFQADDGDTQTDLTGAVDPGALAGTVEAPLVQGTAEQGLGILTTGAAVTGWVTFTQESSW
ncbi:MAG TPA: hypothetical protein VFT50_09320 [Baekduia sp.]|nr:hypothetical protein [Baekduia sp.]